MGSCGHHGARTWAGLGSDTECHIRVPVGIETEQVVQEGIIVFGVPLAINREPGGPAERPAPDGDQGTAKTRHPAYWVGLRPFQKLAGVVGLREEVQTRPYPRSIPVPAYRTTPRHWSTGTPWYANAVRLGCGRW